ncbi:hypothetical protein ACVNIS_24985 (plasmid) [Sphaerotilaceae bacterium SBD11-9]
MSESKPSDEAARQCALLRAAEALQGEVAARCKRLDHCAEWESVTWRYGVPEIMKPDKTKGRCLCDEHRQFFARLSRR